MTDAIERFREIECVCGREQNSEREIERETCHVMVARVLVGSDGVSVVVTAVALCVVLRGVLCACVCGRRGCTRTFVRQSVQEMDVCVRVCVCVSVKGREGQSERETLHDEEVKGRRERGMQTKGGRGCCCERTRGR